MPQHQISYAADASFLAALPLLDYWQDSPLARQTLRETMHPAGFWPRISGVGFGTGEDDYDFFQRLTAAYIAPGAQSWQEIAHRIGWLDGEPSLGTAGWLHSTLSPKYYLQSHYRAKVLADYFGQAAIKAKFGTVNWPALMGVSEALLQQERDFVAEVVKEEAKQDAKIPFMGYVALALITFGVGQAVAVAVAAAAEAAAAAAAAEAAATVGTEAAIAVGSEAMTQTLIDIGLEVATKVTTQEIMSLVTTGELVAPDPLKLALTVADNLVPSDLAELAALDTDFPSVDVADVIRLVSAGWGVYEAFQAIESDPSIPMRPTPPPPPQGAAPRPAPIASRPVPLPAPVTMPARDPGIYTAAPGPAYSWQQGELVPDYFTATEPVPDYFTTTGTAPENAPAAIPWWAPVAAIALLILG